MSASRGSAAMAAAVAVIALPGCGLGPGESSSGEATLTVTRDFGSELVLEASERDPPESETVIRFLDREADLTTRYGGGFVQSINGTSGQVSDGRTSDWFFFVNGIESSRGAADSEVRGGDRIWWDYRDWTDAMRVPVVVGSWPEPFAQVSAGSKRLPVRVDCETGRGACGKVAERLADEGVDASIERPTDAGGEGAAAMRVLVGPWASVRSDPVAAQLDDGPATSGVFARFERSGGGWRAVALDQRARPAGSFAGGAGLVAGLARGTEPPTWVVTGTDETGVDAAIELLDTRDLERRYAVLVAGEGEITLPVRGPG